MTSKNAFGSIPLAELKSVPVFFNDRIASRTAWTIATEDTKEKTIKFYKHKPPGYSAQT